MDSTMERWYKAAKERFSVRKYTESATNEELKKLKEVASFLKTGGVRIVVGRREGIFSPLIGRMISGTETFAAIVSDDPEEDYTVGLVGESFVLECTAMGLGTCWLGMSYSKSAANSAVKFKNEYEKIRCVISIGHFEKDREIRRSRKQIYELTGLVDTAFRKLPEWQQAAVNCARIAPSARNAQPWEFDILDPNHLQIAQVSRNFGYGELDCGIAMLHAEIGAAHCGVYGDWTIEDGLPLFTVDYEAAE